MKKVTHSFLFIFFTAQVFGVTPFISEYAEGSSNNKYLEFYNPTDQVIDLSGYAFASAANDVDSPGNYEYWNEFDAGSQIAPGEVFVIAHPSADGAISALADMTHMYLSNGNDGYCLVEGTETNYTVIDCIGDWNGNPGDGGWDVAGVTGATVNHTLVRKPTVATGNPDWGASSGTDTDGSEWIVLGNEDWSNLGFHTYGTDGENIDPIANAGINQTVEIGSQVTIDGSSSVDPDGTIETYSWNQTAGTAVALSATDQAIITFTAPSVVDSLSFTLTVTDNDGSVGSATIFVKTAEGVSNEVFFSEYGEGSGNNKYLEIFNGTGQDIDLSQYAIAACSNGCADQFSWDYPTDITFESGTVLAAGDVYVVADAAADASVILSKQDMTASPLSNGNDVFGLVNAATGEVIDIIGERATADNSPANGTGGWPVAGVENATLNHTLVRKSSIEQGNIDWATSAGVDAGSSEWIVYDQDTWDHLGSHTQAVNAPAVAFNSVAPLFITDAMEIEFTASITTPVGTVTSAVVKYGTSGALINESELYLEGGEVWAGTIPAQQGNMVIQMRIHATNSEGIEGQSAIEERMIASSTPNLISDLYLNQNIDEIVTVKGVVTIGSSLLHPTFTKVYIQDISGRGLCLFSFESSQDIERGDELEVVGYTHLEDYTFELVDFEYRELSSGNALPEPIVILPSQANSSEYEGTLISFTGNVSAVTPVSDSGTKLTVDDVTNVMIWNSTSIDVSSYIVGFRGQFIGIGSQFGEEYQLLIGYQSDITTVVSIGDDVITADIFDLRPAYPNPFNPSTKLSFSINKPSDIRMEIFDINGKLVDTIISGFFQSGLHIAGWNASGYSSGMYFVHLIKGHQKLTQKVLLLK